MKLYEFTYHDNENLSESAALLRLKNLLEAEAEMQGWASGYKVQQCKEVQQTSNGERIFTFEVIGKLLDSNFIDFDEDLEKPETPNDRRVAKDADL